VSKDIIRAPIKNDFENHKHENNESSSIGLIPPLSL